MSNLVKIPPITLPPVSDKLRAFQSLSTSLERQGLRIKSPLGEGSFARAFLIGSPQPHTVDKVVKLFHDSSAYLQERGIIEELGTKSPVPHAVLYSSFPDAKCEALLSEHVGGKDLCKLFLETETLPTTQQLISIFSQLLESLESLQKKLVIHGDVKPENILFDGAHASLIDYGFSVIGSPKMTEDGTSFYKAPEIILGFPQDSSIDIWALACVGFELYTGTPLCPLQDSAPQNEFLSVFADRFGLPAVNELLVQRQCDIEDWYTSTRHSNWKDAMKIAAQKKGDSEEVVNGLINLLEPMFGLYERISPTKALQHPLFQEETKVSITIINQVSSTALNILKIWRRAKVDDQLAWDHPVVAEFQGEQTRCLHLAPSEGKEYLLSCENGGVLWLERTFSIAKNSSLKIRRFDKKQSIFVINPDFKRKRREYELPRKEARKSDSSTSFSSVDSLESLVSLS